MIPQCGETWAWPGNRSRPIARSGGAGRLPPLPVVEGPNAVGLRIGAAPVVSHGWLLELGAPSTGPSRTDTAKPLRAPMDTKQIQMMAAEIYRWGWSDRSRGDKLLWKAGIYGVAMRGGL